MIETIKNDLTTARKETFDKSLPEMQKEKLKQKVALLNTLYSDIVMFGKNNGNRETTEGEAVKIIKKFAVGVEETIKLCEKSGRDSSQAKFELEVLNVYLPKQLSESELTAIITKIVDEQEDKTKKSMGKVMASLKEKYDGQYDGKLASTIVKNMLK